MLRIADGTTREIALEPMTVAEFHRRVMAMLAEVGIPVRIWSMPVEIPNPIRFEQDTGHHHYERDPVERLWTILQSCDRVLTDDRCSFVGKCSPVHFFWGSFDLAVTRFSGRTAPPREGPAFMREAYSHEVISHGFWPGNDAMPEPVFYALRRTGTGRLQGSATSNRPLPTTTARWASSCCRTTQCEHRPIPTQR